MDYVYYYGKYVNNRGQSVCDEVLRKNCRGDFVDYRKNYEKY